eukprot:TRINITY_DN18722_c0_g1_i1.p1 TRINITY_DN18722_c0_g1~~TRINITY_DN18722_c0_g1_i1.p1  ORF type:complete len:225 (+),score=32.95 TRINITY_DN18722_c0_g1_i1:105-779(+)
MARFAPLVLLIIAVALAASPTRPARPTRPTGRPTFPTRSQRPTRPSPTRPGPTRPGRPTRPAGGYSCDSFNVTDAGSCKAFCGKHSADYTYTPSNRTGIKAACCCKTSDGTADFEVEVQDKADGNDGRGRRGFCCQVSASQDPHDPASCSTLDWLSCGSDVSNSFVTCKSICYHPDDDDDDGPEKCYACIQKSFQKSGGSLSKCCPCIWRLAERANEPNLQIDC